MAQRASTAPTAPAPGAPAGAAEAGYERDWLTPAERWVAHRYGFAPAVARRLVVFRCRWRAQMHYGFTRAEAERLISWRWLAQRRGELAAAGHEEMD